MNSALDALLEILQRDEYEEIVMADAEPYITPAIEELKKLRHERGENDMLDTLLKANIIVMKDAAATLTEAEIVIRDLLYQNKCPHERFANAERWLDKYKKIKRGAE
jgi:hypothetical protein